MFDVSKLNYKKRTGSNDASIRYTFKQMTLNGSKNKIRVWRTSSPS